MSIPKRFQSLALGLLMAPLGMLFGYAMGKMLKGNAQDLPLGYGIVPVLFLVLWLVLAIHELGHLVGGWIVGFKFQLYAVGPLRLDREGERIRISFNKTASLWGGIAAACPNPKDISNRDALRRKMLLLVAGGPVASLLGGLFAFPAFALWKTQPEWAAAFIIFATVSILIALVTMVPIGNAGFVNDGARILNLMRGDEDGLKWISSATLGALSTQFRPREWPHELIEHTTRDPQPTYDGIMAMWIRYSWHLDRKELPEAKLWLERALSHVNEWPAAARPILHSSAADFYARIEPDLSRAKQHLIEASKPGFVPKETLALSEASVLMAEGNHSAAREKLLMGRKLLDNLSGTSRESFAEILDEIEAKTH